MRLVKAEAELDPVLTDTTIHQKTADGHAVIHFERGRALVRVFAMGREIFVGLGENATPMPLAPERDPDEYTVNTAVGQIVTELRQPIVPRDT